MIAFVIFSLFWLLPLNDEHFTTANIYFYSNLSKIPNSEIIAEQICPDIENSEYFTKQIYLPYLLFFNYLFCVLI